MGVCVRALRTAQLGWVCVRQVKTKCQGKEAVVEKSILPAYYVHSLLIMVDLFPSIISLI